MIVTALQWLFWGSLVAVAAITLGYPLLLLVTSSLVGRRWEIRDIEPTVSLIISAYNEESVIEEKIENSLRLSYPKEKLEIRVASDGSDDRTDELVRRYADRGVALVSFPRTGKTGMQNRMAETSAGEILVFSDANAMYEPDAIRNLVRNFADPAVGGVCGQLDYVTAGQSAGDSESAYWRYEKFMKRRESALSSVVGANGSIYAIRRCAYVPIAEDLISDLVEPLAVVRNGYRFVYEPEALSVEEATSTSYEAEFRRKVRILTRSIRGLLAMRALLNPFRFGVFSLQLLMHKALRFVSPLFLAGGALALTLLAIVGQYQSLLAVSVLGLAGAATVVRRNVRALPGPVTRICHLAYYYVIANLALVLAWRNVLSGNHMVLWSPQRNRTR